MKERLSFRAKQISPSVTLAIDAKAKQMIAEGVDVISFGVGEPDFDTPEHIRQAGIDAINSGFTRYTPAAGIAELKAAICAKFERDNGLTYTPDQIVVSNGAKHSLYNALQVLVDKGDEVIIPVPYWVSYTEMVKLAGATPVFVEAKEENDFKLQVADLEAAVTENTRVLMLNSPSNPTGMVYSEDELKAIADFCLKHNLFVISDEIYEELVYDVVKHYSIATVEPKIKDMTIVVNGMSKAFAMTGWRIGYAAAHVDIAKAMSSLQSHATSNPNSIAQKASVAGLTGSMEPVQAMVAEFSKRRDYMVERVNQIAGLSCRKPQGAFYVMANVKELIGRTIGGEVIKDDLQLAALLLDKAHVAVVPGAAFGAAGYMRLSYATSMEKIKEGLDRIDKFING
ncbi:MAG: pyridoxal phosphate-dependent aminotransferase [Firmicutes bacterium]|nr:pyridoxal phosphate-dependent aminotransferase [Bacillota bacterium]